MPALSLSSMSLLLVLPLLAAAGSAPTSQAPPTVDGIAQDAKGGAVVVAEDGRVLYLQGLDGWPEGVAGRKVRVTGHVTQTQHLPVATQDAEGAWSQGVAAGSGLQPVIHAPEWALLPVSGLEPPPWSVRYADGSGNVTRLWMAPGDLRMSWSYAPVTPMMSSSGTYSGGSPGEGQASEAQATALWGLLRTIEADPSLHSARREKGTGALSVTTPAGRGEVLVRRSAALTELDALVVEIRGG